MELYRVDYTLLGMVSSNCMKVLPISHNDETEIKTQKVMLPHALNVKTTVMCLFFF